MLWPAGNDAMFLHKSVRCVSCDDTVRTEIHEGFPTPIDTLELTRPMSVLLLIFV